MILQMFTITRQEFNISQCEPQQNIPLLLLDFFFFFPLGGQKENYLINCVPIFLDSAPTYAFWLPHHNFILGTLQQT